jgi:hypothetical protein
MRKLNLAWMVAISFLPAACRNDKPPTVKEAMQQAAKIPGINAGSGTFDIRTPDGWKRTDKKLNGINITFLLAPKMSGAPFQASINILTQSLAGLSFDKFFDGVMSGAEETMQVVEKGGKEINGLSSKWVRCSGIASGRQLDAIIYGIPGRNGIVYVITCGTPKGQMEKYLTEFDKAVNSFQVHGMIKAGK